MVAFPLVAAHIESGRLLLDRLSHDGFQIALAFWSNRPDADDWELFIASPIVETDGIRAAYGQVNETERKLRLESGYVQAYGRIGITLRRPDNEMVVALAKVLTSTPGRGDVTVSHTVANGVYIEQAYIYRMGT